MPQIILATRNVYKTSEVAAILGPDFDVIDLSAFADLPEIPETGNSFEENATLKALVVSKDRRLPNSIWIMADDSGLEVDALHGAPGIYSARYAGEQTSDRENIEKLLRALADVSTARRTARFRCVIALARDGKLSGTFEGVVEGTVIDCTRGTGGFGYDPVFVPQSFKETFAELSPEIKNQISHRARALQKLKRHLQNQ